MWLRALSATALRLLVGAQPQGDVDGQHRLSHHANQIVVQCFEVRLVPQLGREGFQGPSSIVLAAVEALVYERLDATTQRGEQSAIKRVEATTASVDFIPNGFRMLRPTPGAGENAAMIVPAPASRTPNHAKGRQ